MRGSAVVLIAVVFLGACGWATREVVRSSIDEETQRANLNKLHGPIRELAGEVAKGVIEAAKGAALGATSPELTSRVDAAVERFVRTVLHAASDGLDADVSPAMARAVRATINEALAAFLSDGTKHGVSELTDALTAAAMAGLARGIREQIGPAAANALDTHLGPAMQRMIEHNLGPAIAEALQHDLGPAFAETLRHDLGPAFAATLKSDLTPAVAEAARSTAAAAGEGFVDGVNHRAGPLVDRDFERLQAVIDKAEQDAHSVLRFVPIALLAIVIGALAVVLWLRHQAANAGRDALHLVTSEIGRMSAEPAIVELAQRIKTAGEGRRAGAFLAAHLRSHPSSKVKPPLQAAAAAGDAHSVGSSRL
jgi:hypothetical protein